MAAKPHWWVDPILSPPPPEFCVIVDTREQLPLFLDGFQPWTRRGTLQTGDYSLAGYESRVCLERKSIDDLFGSCAQGRARFEREWARMAGFDRAALLLEATYRQVINPIGVQSAMNPTSVEGTILAWSHRYRVDVLFAGSHQEAARLAFRWLAFWWLNEQEEL